jgi:hypothetical protein
MQSGKWGVRESMEEAVMWVPVSVESASWRVEPGVAKDLERWWRMGVRRSVSSRRGRARDVNYHYPLHQPLFSRNLHRENTEMGEEKTYLKALIQPRRKLRKHHTHLLPTRHIRLPPFHKNLPSFHQLRNCFPINLKPPPILFPQSRRTRQQLRPKLPLLLLAHCLPIEIQTFSEALPFPRVITLKTESEEGCFDTSETTTEVFGRGKSETEDEMGVMIFLPFEDEFFVVVGLGGGCVWEEGEVFLEERFHVCFCFFGGFVAEGTCF